MQVLASPAEVSVLRQLPDTVLARILAASRELQVRKDAIVFRRGDAAALYLLQRGRVAIHAELAGVESNGALLLAIARAGQLFGEASLFSGSHVNEARALEASIIRQLDARACRAALEAHPRAALALTTLMAERRMVAEARLCELASASVQRRVLLQLQRFAGEASVGDSRGRIIADRLTHEELGRLVGASRVAVSRALGALRRCGHITVSGRRFIVPHETAAA
jgi:CRP-like cAMP-binding protein